MKKSKMTCYNNEKNLRKKIRILIIVFVVFLILSGFWVIQFGMIACVMVLPLAFICGHIRHIPYYWQLIDCSFGVIGIMPLFICYKNILKLEQYVHNNKTNEKN